MPKTVEFIRDSKDAVEPLRKSYRKTRISKDGRNHKVGRVLVRCGCCRSRLEIYTDNPKLSIDDDSTRMLIEINGVEGTVDQWRKVFCPMLGLSYP